MDLNTNNTQPERVAETSERLKEAIRISGKKPVELAKETGLNHGTVSRYLSGKIEPRQGATVKLAQALNVSEMWLWGYDVPMTRTPEQNKNSEKPVVQDDGLSEERRKLHETAQAIPEERVGQAFRILKTFLED